MSLDLRRLTREVADCCRDEKSSILNHFCGIDVTVAYEFSKLVESGQHRHTAPI